MSTGFDDFARSIGESIAPKTKEEKDRFINSTRELAKLGLLHPDFYDLPIKANVSGDTGED